MKVIGETEDGRKIMKGPGGVTFTETPEKRDERLEEAAYELVRNTAPELLQACKGLLAVIREMQGALEETRGGGDLTQDEKQAVDYALAIVQKLDPNYGKVIDTGQNVHPDITP